MNRLKGNWLKVVSSRAVVAGISLLILVVSVTYFLFVFDIGFNSTYFAKRDFNSAFYARMAGDCDKFIQYVVQEYEQEWFSRCLQEKQRYRTLPITEFGIKNISINNEKAFLQTELTREKDKSYAVNYEMKRTYKNEFLGLLPTTRFLISQEINN